MTKDSPLKRSHTTNGHGESSRRKERHVSRACNICRKRKSKCDGQQPYCSTCIQSGQECTWTTEEDGRRPVTKGQVDAYKAELQTLRSKVELYEQALREQGLDPDALAASQARFTTTPPPAAVGGLHPSGSSLSITIPLAAPVPGHARSVSSPNPMLSLSGSRPHSPFSPYPHSPGSPFPHSPGSPFPHSPASVTSSLPSPLPGGSSASPFLTVPPMSGMGHRRSLSETGSIFSTSTEEESVMSDSDNELSPFATPGKRLLIGGDGDELVAVAGSSPLALSPPHSPSPGARSRGNSFSVARSPTPDTMRDYQFPDRASTTLSPVPVGDGALHTLEGFLAPFGGPTCPCAWSRHIAPAVAGQLSSHDHDTALGLFLLHGAPWEMRVVPRLFLRDMRAVLSTPKDALPQRTAHYSPALHNAVLAEAGALAPPDSLLSRLDIREALAREARERVEEEVRAPTVESVLSAVQALALLARYHCGLRGGSTLAFMYHGMAVRVAQIAGLDMDCSELVRQERLTSEDKWARDMCYWSLLCQDVDMSLHVGQELSLPRRMDEPALESESAAPDSEAWTFPPPAHSPSDAGGGVAAPAHVQRTFAASVALFRIAARVVELTGQRRPPDSHAVMQTNLAIAEWLAALPEALQVQNRGNGTALPHVLMLNIACQWIVIVLHRSFYSAEPVSGEQAGSAKTHSQFINEAAAKILRLTTQFDRLYGLARAPLTAVQAVFAAASINLLRAHLEKSGAYKRRRDALVAARQGVAHLRSLGAAWDCAQEYAERLEARINEIERGTRQDTSDTARMNVDQPGPHRHAHSHSVPALIVRSASPGPGVLAHHRHTEPAPFAYDASPTPSTNTGLPGSPLSQFDVLYTPAPDLFNSFGGPAQAGLGLGVDFGTSFGGNGGFGSPPGFTGTASSFQHNPSADMPLDEYGVAAAGAQLEGMSFASPVGAWADESTVAATAGMIHPMAEQPQTAFPWSQWPTQ